MNIIRRFDSSDLIQGGARLDLLGTKRAASLIQLGCFAQVITVATGNFAGRSSTNAVGPGDSTTVFQHRHCFFFQDSTAVVKVADNCVIDEGEGPPPTALVFREPNHEARVIDE
jgi:hypothetical protein